MRKGVEESPSGLVLPQRMVASHTVSPRGLVLVEGNMTLGYGLVVDKRVSSRVAIKGAELILATPHEVTIVEFGKRGEITPTPFKTTETHKATRIHVKSRRKVVRVDPFILDFKRDEDSNGRNLALQIMLEGDRRFQSEIVATNVEISSLQVHLDQMALAGGVVFEG